MHLLHPDLVDLAKLAPTDLPTRRTRRYHGDDQAVKMEGFTEADQTIVRCLYHFLCNLLLVVRGESAERPDRLHAFVEEVDFEELCRTVGRFGIASYQSNPDKLLGQVIHDVRGGGLNAILGLIQLWRVRRDDRTICDTLYFLARDHLKIMRNALRGLDDGQRDEDLELKLHSTDLIVEKWGKMRLRAGNDELKLEAFCPHSVPIAECCVEFGALDRILYNLLNNAARHTSDQRVRLILLPVPDVGGPNLRFILQNSLKEEDAERLANVDLKSLFQLGVSTTGSGFGLAVVSEFVANAYGFANPEDALNGGYLGARMIGSDFTVWFHWPIVAEE